MVTKCAPRDSWEMYRTYVDGLPIVEALWWFIENINSDDSRHNDWFFYMRRRYRAEV